MIAWFAKNDIAANLLMIIIVLAGGWSLAFNLPQQVFPQLAPPQIEVEINHPGTNAQDVETNITKHVENILKELPTVIQISSESKSNQSLVRLTFASKSDAEKLLTQVKVKIDSLNTLPAEIDSPIVSLKHEFTPVISLVVYGEQSDIDIQNAAELIKQELAMQPELKKIEIRNSSEYEISIQVSNQSLRKYQLQLNEIAQAINLNAQDLSAGSIFSQSGEIVIRSNGRTENVADLANIIVKYQANGTQVKLGQIAEIKDQLAYQQIKTRFNGHPAIFIDVLQNEQQKATKLAEIVKRYVEHKKPLLSDNIKIDYWGNQAEILKDRLEGLAISALYGGILVLLMLTLFLRPAVAFWVFIGIPISFMGAFVMMPILGVSINIVSLFGFILVLGMVVDDAIVTGENVYTHLEHAESGLHAAVSGTKEVAQPVTLGVLTSIVAFTPLFFVQGSHGVLLSQIPAVVIPVLLLSLVESKWVLPSRLKFVKLQPVQNKNSLLGWQQRFAARFEMAIIKYYQPVLVWCIGHLSACVIIFIGFFLVVMSAVFTGENKFMFFPKISSDKVVATISMPSGTDFKTLDEYILHINKQAVAMQLEYVDSNDESVIKNILSISGSTLNNTAQGQVGQVSFDLVSDKIQTLNIDSFDLEQAFRQKIGILPGVESLVIEAEAAKQNQLIDIRVSGQNLSELDRVSNILKAKLATFKHVQDIYDNYSQGKQTLLLELTPLAQTLGLTRSDLVQQVKAAFFGIEVQRILRGDQNVKVMLRLAETERKSMADLKQFLINLPNNRQIPFSQLANLKMETGPDVINRVDNMRSIEITADLSDTKVDINQLNQQLKDYIEQVKNMYPNVDIKLVGESQALLKTISSLQWGILAASILIYAIIAIPFKSYSQPLIVMSVIPFSLIGSMGGHWLLSLDLTIMSFVGIMALVGVVVNDAVVLVDFINKRYKSNKSFKQAVLKVASTRFRPVILTSVTTFLGLLPIILDQSSQAHFLVPMAVSLGFGIILAPFITLILVPVNYLILARTVSFANRLTHR